MKEEIILIGGGGHCKSCIDIIEKEGRFKIAGIIDLKENINKKVFGYKIIGSDEDLEKIIKKYKYFLITIGQIKNPHIRKEKFDCITAFTGQFPVIVSPTSYVSDYAIIEKGTIVMHKAFVNANAKIGKNCIINSGAVIEHDTVIGDHCHISTNSVINGVCNIGSGVFIGSNSTILNDVSIADESIIGAGSVVSKTISEKGMYIGNPLRRIK